MPNLVNVHDGTPTCPSIAFVRKGNIGIAPTATYSTVYAVHDRERQEGYIGFFDNGTIQADTLAAIKDRLLKEMQPATMELSGGSSLDILVGGTEIRGLKRDVLTTMDKPTILKYERDVRDAIAEIFGKEFPAAKITLRFNDVVGSSNCLVYVPHLDFMGILTDTSSWER